MFKKKKEVKPKRVKKTKIVYDPKLHTLEDVVNQLNKIL